MVSLKDWGEAGLRLGLGLRLWLGLRLGLRLWLGLGLSLWNQNRSNIQLHVKNNPVKEILEKHCKVILLNLQAENNTTNTT